MVKDYLTRKSFRRSQFLKTRKNRMKAARMIIADLINCCLFIG